MSGIDALMHPFTKKWSIWSTVFPSSDFQVSLWIYLCGKTVPELIHSYVPQKSHNLSSLSFMTPKPNFPGTSSLAVNVITPYLSVQISHHHTHIMTTATSKRVLQLLVKFILFLTRHIFLGACVCITVSFLCFK